MAFTNGEVNRRSVIVFAVCQFWPSRDERFDAIQVTCPACAEHFPDLVVLEVSRVNHLKLTTIARRPVRMQQQIRERRFFCGERFAAARLEARSVDYIAGRSRMAVT